MFNSHRIQSQHQEIISKRLLIFHKLSAVLSRHFLIMLNIYEIKKRPNTMNSPRSDLVSGEMFFAWSHLLSLSLQHSECLNSKNETRAPHLRREESGLLGNASSHLPSPTLPLSKGISEPAIWKLGNSAFSFLPTFACNFDIKSLYCAKKTHLLAKTFQLQNY